MVSLGEIRRLADTIVREYRPERVVLFGSYASGTAREDSDIDLLVVMPFRGNRVRKAVEILGKLETRAAVDLVVRTPADVRCRVRLYDFMHRSILDRGKVLRESPRA
jgi:predicted nucleotidyltransferase